MGWTVIWFAFYNIFYFNEMQKIIYYFLAFWKLAFPLIISLNKLRIFKLIATIKFIIILIFTDKALLFVDQSNNFSPYTLSKKA